MVLDLQAGDPKPLSEIQLQAGDDLSAFVSQGPVGIQFAVKAGLNSATIVQSRRGGVGQRPAQCVRQG